MCRILIGPSVRLMLAFDVLQGSMPRPRERWRETEGERDADFGGLRALEGLRESLHSLPGDGFIVCPSASDTLTSIVSASCETKGHFWPFFFYTTLYKAVVQGLTAG